MISARRSAAAQGSIRPCTTTGRSRRPEAVGRGPGKCLDPRQIGYLILYVTNRCNFRCPFCFYVSEIAAGCKAERRGAQVAAAAGSRSARAVWWSWRRRPMTLVRWISVVSAGAVSKMPWSITWRRMSR